jgi:uncharacterized protein
MELSLIPITKPEDANVILSQTHFVKLVENLHEVQVNAMPGICDSLAIQMLRGEL